MDFEIRTWFDHREEGWNKSFYASKTLKGEREEYDEIVYLHKNGIWQSWCDEEGRFDSVEELLDAAGYELTKKKEAKLSNKDAINAISTLHKYYSQPAIQIPSSMHDVLGMSFIDAIKEDPYKL